MTDEIVSHANEIVHDLTLEGCRPEPLAHYLKALGVLRLVAEQADPTARGYWKDDVFHLVSRLDREGLLRFFLEEYEPTPVIAPWNGGSGFHPNDNQTGIQAIESSDADRFACYRHVIKQARQLLDHEHANNKETLLGHFRSRLEESVLAWLDAVFVLTTAGAKYPPLLGTGGNDGRLDFTNNFMQRLIDCIPMTKEDAPATTSWAQLDQALFEGGVVRLLRNKPIGQFFPGYAGGVNTTSSFSGDSLVNPWDFVLMIEGALFFGAAIVKRIESMQPGTLAYPFTVRQSASGFPSGKAAEPARAEMWLPIWPYPARLTEAKQVFSEGRASLGKRQAHTGMDFARSVATLGVDRGISAFVRYGFQERNGRAYFATPLGRWEVQEHPEVRLLDELNGWLEELRRSARDKSCPGSISAAFHHVEEAVFNLCRHGGARRFADVLIALGKAERVCGKSISFCKRHGLRPIQPLDPAWLQATDDGSVEFRLAAALASIHDIRQNVENVVLGPRWAKWNDSWKPWVVWSQDDLVANLGAIMLRRLMDARRRDAPGAYPVSLQARLPVALEDVASFVDHGVDDGRIRDLFLGLCLIDWRKAGWQPSTPIAGRLPDVRYGVLKLCFLSDQGRRLLGEPSEGVPPIPPEPAILRRLAGGDLSGAIRLACRRLAASGLPPRIRAASGPASLAVRLLAILLLPLSISSEQRLRECVCNVSEDEEAA